MTGAGFIMTGLLVVFVLAVAVIRAVSVLHQSGADSSDPLQDWDLYWGDE